MEIIIIPIMIGMTILTIDFETEPPPSSGSPSGVILFFLRITGSSKWVYH